MRLITKATLWTALLSLLLALNFALDLRALRELQNTDRITGQHYEVSQWVRGLQSSLFHFEVAGLRSALGLKPVNSKTYLDSRQELEKALRAELNPEVVQADVYSRYEESRSRLRRLLDNSRAPGSYFTHPQNLKEVEQVRSNLQNLTAYSESIVMHDRDLNEGYFRKIYPLIWAVFLVSLLAVVWRFFHFRKQVLHPIQALIELIEEFRAGNTSARWELGRLDEIGDAGRTLNRLLAELSQRRRERINFIGAVAHDIKNPLSAIAMTCDLILRNKAKMSEAQTLSSVERIKGQVLRLTHLTEDLLMAAKDNRPVWQNKVASFRLGALVAATVELARSADPQHRFAIVSESELPEIHADPERVTQVLTNLISNAAKYSPRETEIEIAFGAMDSGVYLEIRDRGVGIPDEKKKTVFQPFNRLASGMAMSAGTGLGLVIVRDIVESHSGEVRILDREGGGTIFRVELPTGVSQDGVKLADHKRAS